MTEDNKHWMERAFEEIEQMTPDSGFNVVGVDGFAMAGEALYFIAHFETRAEAEACRDAHTARTGAVAHVYEPRKTGTP